jgi:hypothetical protein
MDCLHSALCAVLRINALFCVITEHALFCNTVQLSYVCVSQSSLVTHDSPVVR